jgi:hypothetical protein
MNGSYTYGAAAIRMSMIALIAVLFVVGTTTINSAAEISITGNNGLSFGTIARSGTATVSYSATSAARFTVTGDTLKNVRLAISVVDLSTSDGTSVNSSDRSMAPTVVNADCAFSLDGGSNWTTFSTGTLYHDTQFPSGSGATSSILVRVGGSLAAQSRQQRGTYQGQIILSATYR